MKRSFKILIISNTLLVFNSYAQVQKNLDYYHTLQTNYSLINPAYSILNEHTEVGSNYESFRGVQDVYKRLDFYAISKQQNKVNLGLHLYSDVEESYSSLTFFKVLINYQLIKTDNWKVGVGAYIGTVNYWLRSNQFYGGSSDWKFSSQFGAFAQNKGHQFGFSAHHLTVNQFTPLQEPVGFTREYNFFYKEQVKLNRFVKLLPYSLYSIREGIENQWYIGIEAEYYEKYDVQVMMEQGNTLVVGANTMIDISKESILKIGLSYAIHFYEITTESYQIRIIFFL